jgi:hypothetical protein
VKPVSRHTGGDAGWSAIANAYEASVNSLAARRVQNVNDGYGLFEGPGFMNDGIAGYPVPPDSLTGRSGFVLRTRGPAT